MKMRTLFLAAATAAVGTGAAQAQTAGIATTDPARVIAASKAYAGARQQISTQYKSYLDQMPAKNEQIDTLTRQLDANNDGQITPEEQQAKPSVVTQTQSESQAMAQLQAPIVKAQMYAIEQIAKEYNNAQQQVVSDRKISVILSPDSILYAPDATDVTEQIVNALDGRVASVSLAVPPEWQPMRQTVALHEQIQNIIAAVIRAQAAQQAAQGQSSQATSR